MNSKPVTPEIFRFVDEAISELEDDREVNEPLDIDSPIREFCRTFYEQFFAYRAGKRLRTISKESAVEATLLLKDSNFDWSEEERRLLRRFQHLCKLDSDIRGHNYGGDGDIFLFFHQEFVVDFIDEICAWASKTEATELASRASSAGPEYAAAVEKALDEDDGDD